LGTLVTNYKADGSLPTNEKGFGFGGGFRMGGQDHGGERGQGLEINKQ
jgi:hypothetical protein